ncbi:hypothetical protein N7491_005723 [Penicillium cf. griseofulvum]|uniref:BTB domain-containing protein n=1 Tax=Penicillium cf. griseofulvum TaxID=2972120 RepID=A0A9W9J6V9_9EURO|nr:hypothetical protein N7472_008404 [Penicillium cf. griseofulvum]KAJ5435128.1 hypothetical protein N7491_005723 [Penicillium cf. griseofulvum]KAJ5452960.1 hypothetical protein N7445_001143 [Penicillium cf. griseofulvum]
MGSLDGKAFESIFKEVPRKAIVGKNKTIFYVQPGALLQGNSVLTARLTGPWKNAGPETLDWSVFDEETIDCVLRFCYGQRKYDIPWQSDIGKGESEPEPKLTEPDADTDAKTGTSLDTRSYTGDAIVLHAKVYSFGHQYLMEDLKSFAVTQMNGCFEPCLKECRSSPRATSLCLAEAVRIIYENTLSSNTKMDPARKELCAFIASSYENLSPYFAQFHEGTGNFMVDLARNLATLLQSFKNNRKLCPTDRQRRRHHPLT